LDKSIPGSSTYNQQIPYIPFESFSGLQSINYKTLTLGWNSIFNGYRYMLGENIYANYLPSWWLHDLNISYKLLYKMLGIKVKAEINNLFDKQYDVVKSFPMPGRSYNLSLMFTY
jgi:outer membrane receptor protein involved in Fe transport